MLAQRVVPIVRTQGQHVMGVFPERGRVIPWLPPYFFPENNTCKQCFLTLHMFNPVTIMNFWSFSCFMSIGASKQFQFKHLMTLSIVYIDLRPWMCLKAINRPWIIFNNHHALLPHSLSLFYCNFNFLVRAFKYSWRFFFIQSLSSLKFTLVITFTCLVRLLCLYSIY